jgi:hypothetical protein
MSLEFTRFSIFKRRNGYYYILHYNHGHRRWKATNTRTKHECVIPLALKSPSNRILERVEGTLPVIFLHLC